MRIKVLCTIILVSCIILILVSATNARVSETSKTFYMGNEHNTALDKGLKPNELNYSYTHKHDIISRDSIATEDKTTRKTIHNNMLNEKVNNKVNDEENLNDSFPVQEILGLIDVIDGDMLVRDIIPQLIQVFSLTDQEVKDILANDSHSILICEDLNDYRRMEGIIPPGKYQIFNDTSLKDQINIWIKKAEDRFVGILNEIDELNNLKSHEQLVLASVIEAECLADEYQNEVAAVFLNRLDDNAKMQSCVTAEYALGYQRPFLTGKDVSIQNSYNTYYVEDLPKGPICTVDNKSIKAAMSKKIDDMLYFFYYDYVLNDMFFFSDYKKFKADCAVSRKRFNDNSDINPRAKINKQKLYGTSYNQDYDE